MSGPQDASASSSKPEEASIDGSGISSANMATAPSVFHAGDEASEAGASSGEITTADDEKSTKAKKQKKELKKRKVGQACVYCRRSHMTCDSQRPCTRCVKRDIGHLCHDEAPGKGHGHAHHAVPKNKTETSPGTPNGASQSISTRKIISPGLAQSASRTVLPSVTKATAAAQMSPPPVPTSVQSHRTSTKRPTSASASATKVMQASSFPSQSTTSSGSPTYPIGVQSSTESPVRSSLQSNPRIDFMQAYIAATQTEASSAVETSSSLYPSLTTRSGPSPIDQTMLLRPGDGGRGGRQTLGGQSSDALGSLVSGNRISPSTASLVSLSANTPVNVSQYSSGSNNWPISSTSSAAAGLGGAGFLGLGGSHGLAYGTEGRGGDIAGGNEFNLLSEFLESLDGPGDPMMSSSSTVMDPTSVETTGGDPFPSMSSPTTCKDATPVLEKLTPWAPSERSQQINNGSGRSPRATMARDTKRPRIASDNIIDQSHPSRNFPPSAAAACSASSDPAKLKGFATSTKTERFFLTAADQVDGPRDERLTKVIQAKYDAGLLRPYNHVKGYARFSSWMDTHVSPSSRRRMLKPLSVFRPRFRAVAQSLSDVDLIYIEEAFERLLLDYDRVFSTQGIPACLWRRTGEIYKGNREFAELVGVGLEELREGRLCIYELMEEESACNYWEKYGAVSFDPGQKAVLTSCILTPRPHRWHPAASTTAPANASANARGNLARSSVNGPTTGGYDSGTVTPGHGVGTRPISESLSNSGKRGRQRKRVDSVQASSSDSGSEEGADSHTGRLKHVHCCFSFTIRRDRFGVPTAIVGNFLPIS